MGWRTKRAWVTLRRRVKDRDGWRCRECGGVGRLDAHHITPVSRGGAALDPDNVITLCQPCHHHRHRSERQPPAAWQRLINDAL